LWPADRQKQTPISQRQYSLNQKCASSQRRATIYQFAALEGWTDPFTKSLGQPARRLDLDTQWTKKFGHLSAKEALTPEKYDEMETARKKWC